jgi:hypothetical protein
MVMTEKCWLCKRSAKEVVTKYPEVKPKYGEYELGFLEIPFAGITAPICRVCSGIIMQIVQQNWETLKMNAEVTTPPPTDFETTEFSTL